ncbi:MAG: cytochrome c1 [Pigmentiphaga sp.]
MKKLLGAIALMVGAAMAPATVAAAEAGIPLERAPKSVSDLAALQAGARVFVNQCLNCHAASAVRYSDLRQIGLTDEQIQNNLVFSGETVNDLMKVAMHPADAARWLGVAPPDLSLMARAKSVNAGPSGSDYIYTFLRSFYRDASKLTGWDNLVFPSVGMPHVMWGLQGPRELTKVEVHSVENKEGQATGDWERVVTEYDADGYSTVTRETVARPVQGAHTTYDFTPLDVRQSQAYDTQVANLTAFLTWMSEPNQAERRRIGVWVLLYLGLFLVIAWRLNAVYWKDVK